MYIALNEALIFLTLVNVTSKIPFKIVIPWMRIATQFVLLKKKENE